MVKLICDNIHALTEGPLKAFSLRLIEGKGQDAENCTQCNVINH